MNWRYGGLSKIFGIAGNNHCFCLKCTLTLCPYNAISLTFGCTFRMEKPTQHNNILVQRITILSFVKHFFCCCFVVARSFSRSSNCMFVHCFAVGCFSIRCLWRSLRPGTAWKKLFRSSTSLGFSFFSFSFALLRFVCLFFFSIGFFPIFFSCYSNRSSLFTWNAFFSLCFWLVVNAFRPVESLMICDCDNNEYRL